MTVTNTLIQGIAEGFFTCKQVELGNKPPTLQQTNNPTLLAELLTIAAYTAPVWYFQR